MGSTPSTVSRRDAAVAAALAGTVVVVLGYASGIGIQTDAPSVAQAPVQPAAPTSPTPDETSPAMVMPESVMAAMPVMPTDDMPDMPDMPDLPDLPHVPDDHSTHPQPTETPPDEPEPTPDPEEPTEPDPTCSPALLEELPVLGDTLDPVTSLLTGILGTVASPGDRDGPATKGTGIELDCILGAVIGPKCCGATVAGRTEVEK